MLINSEIIQYYWAETGLGMLLRVLLLLMGYRRPQSSQQYEHYALPPCP